MRPASQELLEVVRGSHQVTSRARVCTRYQTGVDPDGEEIEVYGGDATADGTGEIRSTFDMTTTGDGWQPRAGELLTPYGNEVFVEAGVVVGGGVEWVPLGYHRITSVDNETVDGTVRVAGQDRMAGIIDSKLLSPVQFGEDTTVAEVFDRLVHQVYPSAHITFDWPAGNDDLGRTLIAAGEEEDTDNDRYAFLADLAKSRGKDMFFDHAGVLRVASPPDLLHPAAQIDSGPDGVLVQASRSLTRQGVFNAVVAEGEAADDKPPARAVVYDKDPNSPTYFFGAFGQVPKFYSSPKLKSDNMAVDAAATLLGTTRGLPYSLDLSAVPNPTLEPHDVVMVTHKDGTMERHRLERVPVGLSAEDSWTATTRQQSLATLGGA